MACLEGRNFTIKLYPRKVCEVIGIFGVGSMRMLEFPKGGCDVRWCGMGAMMTGLGSAFGLGFLYFIAAIPAGTAAGAPVWLAAVAAWLGYSLGAAVVALPGASVRDWLIRRLRLPAGPKPGGIVAKVWDRAGVFGLGLAAPVTVGPQAGAALALALGSQPIVVWAAFSVGAVPWCVLSAVLTASGAQLFR